MTEQQIAIIRVNWEALIPIAPKVAEEFYKTLFKIDPTIAELFENTDMGEQGKKLMQTLGTIVVGLGNIEPLIPHIKNLGVNHFAYGVLEEHYSIVGSALLTTLSKSLGPSFDSEAKAARGEVYGMIATTMINASRS
jgi:methyl-accepting chemotaxis protein